MFWREDKLRLVALAKLKKKNEKEVEMRGIDPRTSRMLSERSTIWATPPWGLNLKILHILWFRRPFVLSKSPRALIGSAAVVISCATSMGFFASWVIFK